MIRFSGHSLANANQPPFFYGSQLQKSVKPKQEAPKQRQERRPFQPAEPFEVRVLATSDPEKVAGSIAKALLDGRPVVAEVSGADALARAMLALGLAAAFTEKNGGKMEAVFSGADLKRETVRVEITGRPA